eukprot:4503024-Pyramimonas_sp.AAC.1
MAAITYSRTAHEPITSGEGVSAGSRSQSHQGRYHLRVRHRSAFVSLHHQALASTIRLRVR